MIYALTPIQAIQATLRQIAKIEINALLQLDIEVLQKEQDGRYRIRLGRHTFTSKSQTPLIPGRHYWTQMQESKEGIIHLQKLLPKPSLLQKSWPFDLFDFFTSKEHQSKKDPLQALRDHLLQILVNTTDKQSFQHATSLLLSLHQQVITLPLRYQGKKAMVQMRPPRTTQEEDLNQKSVEFYAAMNNLGPLLGQITLANRRTLSVGVYYPRSVQLLQHQLNHLDGFEEVRIYDAHTPILPFWDEESRGLLDIKG